MAVSLAGVIALCVGTPFADVVVEPILLVRPGYQRQRQRPDVALREALRLLATLEVEVDMLTSRVGVRDGGCANFGTDELARWRSFHFHRSRKFSLIENETDFAGASSLFCRFARVTLTTTRSAGVDDRFPDMLSGAALP